MKIPESTRFKDNPKSPEHPGVGSDACIHSSFSSNDISKIIELINYLNHLKDRKWMNKNSFESSICTSNVPSIEQNEQKFIYELFNFHQSTFT